MSLVDKREELRDITRRFFKGTSARTSGAAVLFGARSGVVLEVYQGAASLELRHKIGPETTFNLASISKTMTAVAAAICRERGLFGFDDGIARYFPELAARVRAVRIRNLLNHTSGLPLHFAAPALPGFYGNQQFLEALARQRWQLSFKPGARFEYCNTGYILLAMLIERVSASAFPDFMRQAVFIPSGMRSARLAELPMPVIPERATGYSFCAEKRAYFPQTARELTLGDGGVYATARDLYRFWRAFIGNRLVAPETRAEMLRASVPIDGASAYGYGWKQWSRPRRPALIGHTGTDAGFCNVMQYDPQKEIVAVILTNCRRIFGENPRENWSASLLGWVGLGSALEIELYKARGRWQSNRHGKTFKS